MRTLTYNNIIVGLSSLLGLLALVYVLEFNQAAAARMRLLSSVKQQQELNLAYQERAIALSPLGVSEKLGSIEEEFKLERIKEFALMEAGEAQLSLHAKKYE